MTSVFKWYNLSQAIGALVDNAVKMLPSSLVRC
jgi:hypothetical protein